LHRAQFRLVLGHGLLTITHLLFLLEQSFRATMRFIHIPTQCRNSWVKLNGKSLASLPRTSSVRGKGKVFRTEHTAS
jgi:hypothetical protein